MVHRKRGTEDGLIQYIRAEINYEQDGKMENVFEKTHPRVPWLLHLLLYNASIKLSSFDVSKWCYVSRSSA